MPGDANLLHQPPCADTVVESGFESSKEQVRLRAYLVLIALDLSSLVAGYLVAGLLHLGSFMNTYSLQTIVVVIPTFMGVALNNGAYSIAALQRPAAGIAKACEALLFSVAAVIAILFYLKVSAEFSRLIFGVGAAIGLLLLVLSRWSFGRWVGRTHAWSFENTLLLVDGLPVVPRPGEVVVFPERAGIEPTTENLAALERLANLTTYCERIVVACPVERRTAWADMLKGCAIDVEILAPEMHSIGAIALRSTDDRSTLVLSLRPLGLRDRFLKRVLDLAIAGSAAIVFAPLLVLIPIAIKLESRGPVLFKQVRVGLNNKVFTLLKFRSMRSDSTDLRGVRSTSRTDERFTKLGALLRRTSFDELPQLFNVLKGDMSIVGPRPHALGSTAEARLFWHIDPRYFHRHVIKPGMTGLAQVRGYRGATVSQADLTDRLGSDLEYISGWTIWRDLKIILETFKVMVDGNAY